MTSKNDNKDVKTTTDDDAIKGKSQILDINKWVESASQQDVGYVQRAHILAASWRAATSPPAPSNLLRNLHRLTLLYVLQEEWPKLEKSLQVDLCTSVENCAGALEKAGGPGAARRLRYLLRTADHPWHHHPTLRLIMEGGEPQPQKEQVESWFREECCAGALERLRQLCAAGGSSCSAAGLRLARALLLLPVAAGARRAALDALLVFLVRGEKTRDCIAEIKALDTREAVSVIARLSTKDKSSGRLWKYAHDTALLCAQVMVAACLVRPIQGNQLAALASQLTSLYSSRPDRLPATLRKLLQQAETALHIYTVCRAVQHQFGETQRAFVCELYIRALTTGMNELERQKLNGEDSDAAMATTHLLAGWFLNLADFLASNCSVSSECVLTAFSLNPSQQCYQRVEECSHLMSNTIKFQEPEDRASDSDNITSTANKECPNVLTSLDSGKLVNSTTANTNKCSNSDRLDGVIDSASLKKDNSDIGSSDDGVCDGYGLAQRLVSGAVLDGEGLGLSSDVCRDLAVLLSGPRLKMLTWELSWKDLSRHCLSYMKHGTKKVTRELKFVRLDYSQYEHQDPQVQDIYYGIEKGYEHHLELEEEEEDEDYWEEEEEEIIQKVVKTSLTEKPEGVRPQEETKKETKKVKKKSTKKQTPSEPENETGTEKVKKTPKVKQPKKEKKQKEDKIQKDPKAPKEPKTCSKGKGKHKKAVKAELIQCEIVQDESHMFPETASTADVIRSSFSHVQTPSAPFKPPNVTQQQKISKNTYLSSFYNSQLMSKDYRQSVVSASPVNVARLHTPITQPNSSTSSPTPGTSYPSAEVKPTNSHLSVYRQQMEKFEAWRNRKFELELGIKPVEKSKSCIKRPTTINPVVSCIKSTQPQQKAFTRTIQKTEKDDRNLLIQDNTYRRYDLADGEEEIIRNNVIAELLDNPNVAPILPQNKGKHAARSSLLAFRKHNPRTDLPSTALPSTVSPCLAPPHVAMSNKATPIIAMSSKATPSTAPPSSSSQTTASPRTDSPSTALLRTASPSSTLPNTALPYTNLPSMVQNLSKTNTTGEISNTSFSSSQISRLLEQKSTLVIKDLTVNRVGQQTTPHTISRLEPPSPNLVQKTSQIIVTPQSTCLITPASQKVSLKPSEDRMGEIRQMLPQTEITVYKPKLATNPISIPTINRFHTDLGPKQFAQINRGLNVINSINKSVQQSIQQLQKGKAKKPPLKRRATKAIGVIKHTNLVLDQYDIPAQFDNKKEPVNVADFLKYVEKLPESILHEKNSSIVSSPAQVHDMPAQKKLVYIEVPPLHAQQIPTKRSVKKKAGPPPSPRTNLSNLRNAYLESVEHFPIEGKAEKTVTITKRAPQTQKAPAIMPQMRETFPMPPIKIETAIDLKDSIIKKQEIMKLLKIPSHLEVASKDPAATNALLQKLNRISDMQIQKCQTQPLPKPPLSLQSKVDNSIKVSAKPIILQNTIKGETQFSQLSIPELNKELQQTKINVERAMNVLKEAQKNQAQFSCSEQKLKISPYKTFLSEMQAMVNAGSGENSVKGKPTPPVDASQSPADQGDKVQESVKFSPIKIGNASILQQTMQLKSSTLDSTTIKEGLQTIQGKPPVSKEIQRPVVTIQGKPPVSKEIQRPMVKVEPNKVKALNISIQESPNMLEASFSNSQISSSTPIKREAKKIDSSVLQTYARKNHCTIMKKQQALKALDIQLLQNQVSSDDNSVALRMAPQKSQGKVSPTKNITSILSSKGFDPTCTNSAMADKIAEIVKKCASETSLKDSNNLQVAISRISGNNNLVIKHPSKSTDKTILQEQNKPTEKGKKPPRKRISPKKNTLPFPHLGNKSSDSNKSLPIKIQYSSRLEMPVEAPKEPWTPLQWGLRHVKNLSDVNITHQPLPSFSTFSKKSEEDNKSDARPAIPAFDFNMLASSSVDEKEPPEHFNTTFKLPTASVDSLPKKISTTTEVVAKNALLNELLSGHISISNNQFVESNLCLDNPSSVDNNKQIQIEGSSFKSDQKMEEHCTTVPVEQNIDISDLMEIIEGDLCSVTNKSIPVQITGNERADILLESLHKSREIIVNSEAENWPGDMVENLSQLNSETDELLTQEVNQEPALVSNCISPPDIPECRIEDDKAVAIEIPPPDIPECRIEDDKAVAIEIPPPDIPECRIEDDKAVAIEIPPLDAQTSQEAIEGLKIFNTIPLPDITPKSISKLKDCDSANANNVSLLNSDSQTVVDPTNIAVAEKSNGEPKMNTGIDSVIDTRDLNHISELPTPEAASKSISIESGAQNESDQLKLPRISPTPPEELARVPEPSIYTEASTLSNDTVISELSNTYDAIVKDLDNAIDERELLIDTPNPKSVSITVQTYSSKISEDVQKYVSISEIEPKTVIADESDHISKQNEVENTNLVEETVIKLEILSEELTLSDSAMKDSTSLSKVADDDNVLDGSKSLNYSKITILEDSDSCNSVKGVITIEAIKDTINSNSKFPDTINPNTEIHDMINPNTEIHDMINPYSETLDTKLNMVARVLLTRWNMNQLNPTDAHEENKSEMKSQEISSINSKAVKKINIELSQFSVDEMELDDSDYVFIDDDNKTSVNTLSEPSSDPVQAVTSKPLLNFIPERLSKCLLQKIVEPVTTAKCLPPKATESATPVKSLPLKVTESVTRAKTLPLKAIESVTTAKSLPPKATEPVTRKKSLSQKTLKLKYKPGPLSKSIPPKELDVVAQSKPMLNSTSIVLASKVLEPVKFNKKTLITTSNNNQNFTSLFNNVIKFNTDNMDKSSEMKLNKVSADLRKEPVVDEIIDLVSDDDIELFKPNDPLGFDNNYEDIPQVISVSGPSYITVVKTTKQDLLIPPHDYRLRRKLINKALPPFLVVSENHNLIRVNDVPLDDQTKLKMICCVKIVRQDLQTLKIAASEVCEQTNHSHTPNSLQEKKEEVANTSKRKQSNMERDMPVEFEDNLNFNTDESLPNKKVKNEQVYHNELKTTEMKKTEENLDVNSNTKTGDAVNPIRCEKVAICENGHISEDYNSGSQGEEVKSRQSVDGIIVICDSDDEQMVFDPTESNTIIKTVSQANSENLGKASSEQPICNIEHDQIKTDTIPPESVGSDILLKEITPTEEVNIIVNTLLEEPFPVVEKLNSLIKEDILVTKYQSLVDRTPPEVTGAKIQMDSDPTTKIMRKTPVVDMRINMKKVKSSVVRMETEILDETDEDNLDMESVTDDDKQVIADSDGSVMYNSDISVITELVESEINDDVDSTITSPNVGTSSEIEVAITDTDINTTIIPPTNLDTVSPCDGNMVQKPNTGERNLVIPESDCQMDIDTIKSEIIDQMDTSINVKEPDINSAESSTVVDAIKMETIDKEDLSLDKEVLDDKDWKMDVKNETDNDDDIDDDKDNIDNNKEEIGSNKDNTFQESNNSHHSIETSTRETDNSKKFCPHDSSDVSWLMKSKTTFLTAFESFVSDHPPVTDIEFDAGYDAGYDDSDSTEKMDFEMELDLMPGQKYFFKDLNKNTNGTCSESESSPDIDTSSDSINKTADESILSKPQSVPNLSDTLSSYVSIVEQNLSENSTPFDISQELQMSGEVKKVDFLSPKANDFFDQGRVSDLEIYTTDTSTENNHNTHGKKIILSPKEEIPIANGYTLDKKENKTVDEIENLQEDCKHFRDNPLSIKVSPRSEVVANSSTSILTVVSIVRDEVSDFEEVHRNEDSININQELQMSGEVKIMNFLSPKANDFLDQGRLSDLEIYTTDTSPENKHSTHGKKIILSLKEEISIANGCTLGKEESKRVDEIENLQEDGQRNPLSIKVTPKSEEAANSSTPILTIVSFVQDEESDCEEVHINEGSIDISQELQMSGEVKRVNLLSPKANDFLDQGRVRDLEIYTTDTSPENNHSTHGKKIILSLKEEIPIANGCTLDKEESKRVDEIENLQEDNQHNPLSIKVTPKSEEAANSSTPIPVVSIDRDEESDFEEVHRNVDSIEDIGTTSQEGETSLSSTECSLRNIRTKRKSSKSTTEDNSAMKHVSDNSATSATICKERKEESPKLINPTKTYQKTSITVRKRKLSFSMGTTLKLPCINLPITQDQNITCVDPIYDNLSVKEVLMMENCSDNLPKSIVEDFDVVSLDNQNTEFDMNDFLYDIGGENPRQSLYSPIFADGDYMGAPADEFISNNVDFGDLNGEDMMKGSGFREGFGFRSGREYTGDLLHGAALSDSPPSWLPKHQHSFPASQDAEDGTTARARELNHMQADLENHLSSDLLAKRRRKRSKNAAKSVSPLGDYNKVKKASKNEDFTQIVQKINKIDDDIFARVPGMRDLDFIRPQVMVTMVNVVQLGQLPVVSSAQQSPLPGTPTRSNTAVEYDLHSASNNLDAAINNNSDIAANNSTEYRSLPHEESQQLGNRENDATEQSSNEIEPVDSMRKETDNHQNTRVEEPLANHNLINNPIAGANNTVIESPSISNEEEKNFNVIQNSVVPSTTSIQGTTNLTTTSTGQIMDGNVQLIFTSHPLTQHTYVTSDVQSEHKNLANAIETSMNSTHTTNTNYIPVSRAQTLVNILSQKILRPPPMGGMGMGTQQVQMATFPKGTPINALSLQQALAQILPPPLSQASADGSSSIVHSSGPQIVHIVQGKTAGQSGNSFSGLLMDNSQQSVINTSGASQLLHIVQGKNTTAGNSTMLTGQAGATFGGLSLMDGSQQGGNQVLHILNAGPQAKNNAAAAQLLKRVNLLTSLTSQGSDQKMLQFLCKSADGKSIQLNTHNNRGMVLRLQPIQSEAPAATVAQKTTENSGVLTLTTTSPMQPGVKKSPQNDQSQEIKSRSIYEENYAKFIQNSSTKLSPISPERSTSLPKFNQAFGKSVFQDNNGIPKDSDCNQIQVSNASVDQQAQDVTTAINLGQMGQLSNPPLLIRKTQSGTTQNIVGQVKTPMNIQTMHGGVIYTRQIPVNIGGGQTINLITVPGNEIMDEAHLQAIQKHAQEKASLGEHQTEQQQVIKLVQQEQIQSNSSSCHIDSASDDANQGFAEQPQNTVSTHPLLTQMRIKVPMLSKGATGMVTGTRVVRPVLQIQRNVIPGTNPAVYQQLVLTTAPALRQPTPASQPPVRPSRPPTAPPQQESNLSSSTLEQLREFDMVLEQVKERSTVQPGSNSNSAFSESSPQRQNVDNSDVISPQSNNAGQTSTQREVLYSIGPNQTVNVTYVNKLGSQYTNSDSPTILNMGQQNSPSLQIAHGLSTSLNHPKPNTPTKASPKSMKPKSSKPTSVTPSSSKASPVAPKQNNLLKPLEDEQTTQRILYILAEYKEQVENSPDKDKPAPRRRSNPPTNPSTSGKRKKGSGGGKKGQSSQEMSPSGDDTGHTMGSEDSSCGMSQGDCGENSIQGPESQSPQGSPQKAARKLVFPQEQDSNPPPVVTQPQRNVIIADGQTIAMTRPGPGGKATAVLMPANYLLPMSMMKGGQQITIVTNQGPKILNVPHGEGGTTNTLFLQRLISPAGLKPMLTRPGQVRQVRLPANTVQNLQAFNLNSNNQDGTSWLGNALNIQQPKLLVEYSPNVTVGQDLINPDSVKSEPSDVQSIKEENMSIGSDGLATPRHSDSREALSDDLNMKNRSGDEGIFSGQTDSTTDDSVQSAIQNRAEQILQHIQVSKNTTNHTVNLIQVHSLNPNEPGKIFSVQNPASLGSLIQLAGKTSLGQAFQTINMSGMNQQDKISSDVQEGAQNLLLVRKQFDGQFATLNDGNVHDNMKSSPGVGGLQQDALQSVDASPSPSSQQNYGISHSEHLEDTHGLKVNSDANVPWSLASNGGSTVSHGGDGGSPAYVGYGDSPPNLTHHQDNGREHTEEGRVLRHPYSPEAGSSPPGAPRHLYHKMFISSPNKHHDHTTLGHDDHHQDHHLKKDEHQSSTITLHTANSPSFTIHHQHQQAHQHQHQGLQHHRARQGQGERHSTPAHVLRHKYALMEHELRLQKSLSEECEDLGVDSPSASDLFPEAELLFAASPSSQFDQSQDGNTQQQQQLLLNSSLPASQIAAPPLLGGALLLREEHPAIQEEEFARMHPNTTFHSGEIELGGDDADDITFRGLAAKRSGVRTTVMRKNEVVRSVIEGVGSSGMPYQPTKMTAHFSMVGLPRRALNIMSSLQSSDDNSEGADSMEGKDKDGLVNNKRLDGMLNSTIIARDVSLAQSPGCIASNIIQRNVAQVIRHANEEQMLNCDLNAKEIGKINNQTSPSITQNGRSFLIDSSNDTTRPGDSMILKSLMMERDGRDGLTCSSPEQHSELFWESNSNSNQSEEPLPHHGPTNLLDFSSEDSNKCCKSPASCEETNSTDSSSIGGLNTDTHKPLRLNSVIKTSGNNSSAADGPILHSALTGNLPNVSGQEATNRKTELNNSPQHNDSNTSTSPDGEDPNSRRTWGRSLKSSGMRRVLSPRSLSAEINMGAEIETSSSDGVNILTKQNSGSILHSPTGSSTPEEAPLGRRASLRGSGQARRSCHCCPPPSPQPHTASPAKSRSRRKPPPTAH